MNEPELSYELVSWLSSLSEQLILAQGFSWFQFIASIVIPGIGLFIALYSLHRTLKREVALGEKLENESEAQKNRAELNHKLRLHDQTLEVFLKQPKFVCRKLVLDTNEDLEGKNLVDLELVNNHCSEPQFFFRKPKADSKKWEGPWNLSSNLSRWAIVPPQKLIDDAKSSTSIEMKIEYIDFIGEQREQIFLLTHKNGRNFTYDSRGRQDLYQSIKEDLEKLNSPKGKA